VYLGIRLIPPGKPPLPELRPIAVDALVLPVAFVEEGPLDINRATAAELEKLPGIGPSLARRIVEWRETRGPFRSVEDLLQVPGIGPKTLEGIRDKITVTPPP
jgi:competence protein ComEA